MVEELFPVKKRSKKAQFREWILARKYTRTSEAATFSGSIFYNRGVRDAQEMAVPLVCGGEELLRRLTDKEKVTLLGIKTQEGIWTKVHR